MKRITLFFLLILAAVSLQAAPKTVTNTNRFGEREILTREGRVVIRREVFLKKKRALKIAIPNIRRYELVLHFLGGRTIIDQYTYRRRARRTTVYPSGLRVISAFQAGRSIWKELRYPPGDGPKDGQIIRTEFAPDGKRKVKETVTFKNKAVITTSYDPQGKMRERTITVPGGDHTIKRYRGGILFEVSVKTPDKRTLVTRYRKDGGRFWERTHIHGWERLTRFGTSGQRVSVQYRKGSHRFIYNPGFRDTIQIEASGPGGYTLAFRTDLLFERDLFVETGRGCRIACIPATNLVFVRKVGGVTNIREVYHQRVLRLRETAQTNGRHWVRTIEHFDQFEKPQSSRSSDSTGRVVTRKKHLNRWEQETRVNGQPVSDRTEFEGGSVRLRVYEKGIVKKETQLDPNSHMCKFIRIFENGKLRWKEEYYADGRLVRSRYAPNGKRTGLYWKRWK